MHRWFIDTNKMKWRFALYKAAVALELIKDAKKLNVSLEHSNGKDLANLPAPAQGHAVFISPLFAYSRLSLHFQELNKVYFTSNMFIQVLKSMKWLHFSTIEFRLE